MKLNNVMDSDPVNLIVVSKPIKTAGSNIITTNTENLQKLPRAYSLFWDE